MPHMNRRTFLQRSLAAAAALSASSYARVRGANDSVRVAVAGLNGRGESHVGAFAGIPGVEVAYLVDPDRRTFGPRLRQIEKAGGRKPETVQDVRRALEDRNLAAISIATTNHWHALMTIWACEAGKDVYVEKPCSHNVREGRIAVETARRMKRIVQHGTQSRSSNARARVAAAVRSGKLGKLLVSRGLCYKPRGSIGVKPPAAVPSELDFDLWLGPASRREYHENLVHYNWHWFWDFGNGDIGNQGVHEMDIARWCIPDATLPKSVISLGGRFGYTDQGETPNTQLAVFDFGEPLLVFEVRGLKTGDLRGQKVGNILHLEAGIIAGDRFFPRGQDRPEPLPDVGEVPARKEGIFENFIACVRSRKQEELHADILEGHYSSALCHLANISYRLGTDVPFNPRTRAFGDDTRVHETLGRLEEHLKENGLQLDGMNYRLGRRLVVDAATETIAGDPQAARLLTREYRAPFVAEKIA
jgi:predicted dehydrogenase